MALVAAWLILGTAAGLAAEPATAPTFSPHAIEFFELQVRPTLATHCQPCHGAKKQELGLRLDSRAAVLQGGDSGPVVVLGKPEESRLLHAVRYNDPDLQMPPEGKLSPTAIAALRNWIELGLPWPESDDDAPSNDHNARLRHWAFQPLALPEEPPLAAADWVRTPVDAFVLEQLQQAGLSPSPPADRRTLIRRLSYDLTGLPPTPAEVAEFLADSEDHAVDRLVDHLLASPQYGERWGRHWLDVARYADSKGYKFFGSNQSYGYTYRDWVIRAFNDDLPYDQFVLRQLAADQLPLDEDNRDLAALGFLTIGRRFLEDQHDIIDDRIDVVSRGLLGLTVACARCHDHKFDPIPTADYYSLYGVFAASVERTQTLRKVDQQSEADKTYDQELARRQGELDQYLRTQHTQLLQDFRGQTAAYLLAGQKALALPSMDKFMFVEVPGQPSQLVIERWRSHLDRTHRSRDRVFAAWHAFAALPEAEFAAQASSLAEKISANAPQETNPPEESDEAAASPHHPSVAALFTTPPASLEEVAQRYGTLLANVERQWSQTLAAAREAGQPEPRRLADDDAEELRRVLYGPHAPP
ncbi:MAG: DUF1549 domain-containing protein, partial [Pirellulales bacterium]